MGRVAVRPWLGRTDTSEGTNLIGHHGTFPSGDNLFRTGSRLLRKCLRPKCRARGLLTFQSRERTFYEDAIFFSIVLAMGGKK
jgi:hypothetical protein